MKYILYSIGCPKCEVLEKKLKQNNIDFDIVSSKEEILSLGITEVPVLKVEDKYLSFSDAIKFINNQKEK